MQPEEMLQNTPFTQPEDTFAEMSTNSGSFSHPLLCNDDGNAISPSSPATEMLWTGAAASGQFSSVQFSGDSSICPSPYPASDSIPAPPPSHTVSASLGAARSLFGTAQADMHTAFGSLLSLVGFLTAAAYGVQPPLDSAGCERPKKINWLQNGCEMAPPRCRIKVSPLAHLGPRASACRRVRPGYGIWVVHTPSVPEVTVLLGRIYAVCARGAVFLYISWTARRILRAALLNPCRQ
jgi:hypothetical protein